MKDLLNEFEGMLRVVQFNWPLYATAAGVVLALLVLAWQPIFASARVFFVVVAMLVWLQTVLSLLASYWVYDRSALKDWRFLGGLIQASEPNHGGEPSLGSTLRIVNVHAGYDETSAALRSLFGSADISTIDLFSALGQREPSIVKARKLYPPSVNSICETIADWPIAESSVDLILVAFAAHEIRDSGQRDLLFQQARQVLKPNGRIVLVEHVRDFANFVAFGPGFVHFLPLAEWIRCATQSNLNIVRQYRITPLVAVLELCL